MLQRRELWVGLCLCFYLATALRLFNLEGLPPGVHFDEAANGLLASEIAFDGERPIFISSYTGKEVLFFYLAAGVMRLVEPSVFGLRLTAVYISLLTLAATFWLGVELFRDKRLALLATVFLALSFWHLLFSRLGFRAITQPLLQALMVAAWLRGGRKQAYGWFIFSGFCLGLLGYSYLAARLFPVLIVLAAIPLLIKRPFSPRLIKQHLLLGAVALLVFAPLLFYFVQNPDAFWVRISQVSPAANEQLTVFEGLQRALQMFFWSGDPYIRFNLPFQPIFNPILGVLMSLGFVIIGVRFWRYRGHWQKSAALLLLLAPFIMLLPTALATNEIVPSNLRAIGLIPFIYFLPAVAVIGLLERNWFSDQWRRALFILLFLLFVTSLTYETAVAYFQEWGNQVALVLETDGDLAAAAAFLDEFERAGETVFVASPHYQHPTVAFLSDHYEQVKWLPESQALVFPARSEAIILYPAKSPAPEWALPYLETAVHLTKNDTNENTFLEVYHFETAPTLNISVQQGANFSDVITLLGYDMTFETEQAIVMTLFWSIDGQSPADVLPFVHLEDAEGYRWSQVETFAYPSEQWEAGDLIIQHIELPIPLGTPPGAYEIKLGLFNPASGDRLARFDENGRYAGDTFAIENIPVFAATPPSSLPSPPIPIQQPISHGLELLGQNPLQPKIGTGEQLPILLHWFAADPVPPITLRFSLLKADGVGGRILADNQPVYDSYPFHFWETPQYVIDRQLLTIPEDTEPGNYILNLRLLDALEKTIGVFPLGAIAVEKTDRLFSKPEMDQAIAATFGNEIALQGYSLVEGDTAVELTLLWQALQLPKADYTVFVHLLTPDGSCAPCVWQQDSMPMQNRYPTRRWLPNEYVLDTYQIELPENLPTGIYPIEIGLYLADSGIRLQVESAFTNSGDALILDSLQWRE